MRCPSGLRKVMKGTTVTWTNTRSLPHTVTADGGSFDSGALTGGGTFSRLFTPTGTWANVFVTPKN